MLADLENESRDVELLWNEESSRKKDWEELALVLGDGLLLGCLGEEKNRGRKRASHGLLRERPEGLGD